MKAAPTPRNEIHLAEALQEVFAWCAHESKWMINYRVRDWINYFATKSNRRIP